MCVMCNRTATIIKKKVIGTSVCITQFCNNCKYTHIRESQPYFGNIPAGKIFTPAAILYTGSFTLPSLFSQVVLGI